jgi:hypothetical protein
VLEHVVEHDDACRGERARLELAEVGAVDGQTAFLRPCHFLRVPIDPDRVLARELVRFGANAAAGARAEIEQVGAPADRRFERSRLTHRRRVSQVAAGCLSGCVAGGGARRRGHLHHVGQERT